MVREHGGGDEIVVPPTIHALLQARIDSLDGDVRVVMERGSVEGEVFHRGSVSVLSPDPLRPAVESHLATLVRKELIRSTSPTFPDDEGFRFRHLLIRDAAYEALPKATRAELHERFAEWLSGHDLVESDEIVGYHLEQAHRYRAELDGSDRGARWTRATRFRVSRGGRPRSPRTRRLQRRPLTVRPCDKPLAGGRRGETRARAGLRGRAARVELRRRLERAVAGEGSRRPGNAGSRRSVDGDHEALYGSTSSFEDSEAWRNEARAVFEESGDEYGLARYWWSVAMDRWNRLRVQETAEAAERAMAHLEHAGERGARLRGMIGSRRGSWLPRRPDAGRRGTRAHPGATGTRARPARGSMVERCTSDACMP